MVEYSQSRLDLAFGALAHPIRRGILARLATGEATVSELAKPFKVSAPAISKHMRILEEKGEAAMNMDRARHIRYSHARAGWRALAIDPHACTSVGSMKFDLAFLFPGRL